MDEIGNSERTTALIDSQEESRLFDAFTLLGDDPAECDVEYALDAQRDVVLRF